MPDRQHQGIAFDMSRRSLLRLGVAVGALAATGTLAGCADGVASGGVAASAADSSLKLPTYVPYNGVTPDLPGNSSGLTDGFFRYPANPVAFTSGVPGDGKTITGLVPAPQATPPAMNSNPFWQTLNKRIGSPMQIVQTPGADYAQKLAITVAGGELPDVTNLSGGVPSQPEMLNAMAVDLTEHLSGDAVKKYPALANIPTDSWRSCVFNGRIYGVPNPRGMLTSLVLVYRYDLLEKLGMATQPKSLDDFYAMCKEITSESSNVWALTQAPIDFIRQGWGIYHGWKQSGGRFTSAYEDARQLDALEDARKLVKAGVLHPDAFASSSSSYQSWFGAGSALMDWGTLSGWPQSYTQNSTVKGFRIKAFVPPSAKGQHAVFAKGSPTNSIAVIGKRAESRVATILDVLNYVASPFGTKEYLAVRYGTKGRDYTTQHGDPVLTATGTSETFIGITYLADAPRPIWISGNKDATKDLYELEKQLLPNAVSDASDGLYSATAFSKGVQLDTNLLSLQNDIMQGRKPVSAWKSAVKTWRLSGGNTIRAEYEKAYAAQH